MGTFGTAIYSNDTSLDVRDDVKNLLSVGKTADEVIDYVMGYKPDEGEEDECAYWTAFADTLWRYGLLTPDIKSKTEMIIQNGGDIDLFETEKDRAKRKTKLEELYKKIQIPKEKPSKPGKYFAYRCSYHQGDVLAIKIEDKFIYFVVCGIGRWTHKIKELEVDQMFVKFFEHTSNDLLNLGEVLKLNTNGAEISFKQLKSDKYIQNFTKSFSEEYFKSEKGQREIYETKYIRRLFCYSKREQKALEKNLIFIGHIETEEQTSRAIYFAYQYNLLYDTLKEVYEL